MSTCTYKSSQNFDKQSMNNEMSLLELVKKQASVHLEEACITFPLFHKARMSSNSYNIKD